MTHRAVSQGNDAGAILPPIYQEPWPRWFNVVLRGSNASVLRRSPWGCGTAGNGTDPRFRTWTEAIAHGYRSYYRGRDVEYGWTPTRGLPVGSPLMAEAHGRALR